MKKILKIPAAVLGFILFCSSPYPLSAEKSPHKTITVVSEAKVSTQPDLAIVSLYFTAYGWSVDKARKKVDRTIKNFLNKLTKEKINSAKIRIGDIKLKPSYQFNRDLKTNVPSDFLVSRQVHIHLEDLSMIGKIMDVSLSIGSFLLESARLTVQEKVKLEREAFKKTMGQARAKAEGIVEGMGKKLGEALQIEEIKSQIEEINLIQETSFAVLAADSLKKGKLDRTKEDTPQGSSEPFTQDSQGFFSLPDGDESDPFSSKSIPEIPWIKAKSKLQVTFQIQ